MSTAKVQMFGLFIAVILLLALVFGVVPAIPKATPGKPVQSPVLNSSDSAQVQPVLPAPIKSAKKQIDTKSGPNQTVTAAEAPAWNYEDRLKIVALLRRRDFAALETAFARLQSDVAGGKIPDTVLGHAAGAFRHAAPDLKPAYDAWIAARPESAIARLARGKHFQAIGWYERGNATVRNTPQERFERMRAAFAKSDADLLAAIDGDTSLSPAYASLIDTFMTRGKDRKVAYWHEAGLRNNPRSAVIRQSYLHSLMPNWGGSVRKLRAYVTEMDKNPVQSRAARYLRGYPEYAQARSLWNKGKHEEALAKFDQAITQGEHWVWYKQRGALLKQMKRYEEVTRSLNRAEQIWPQESGVLHLHAVIAYARQQKEKAFALWRKALELEPHAPKPLRQYAYRLFRAGKLDDAAQLTERAKIYSGGDPWVQYTSARIAYKQKRFADAAPGFEKALSLDPKDLKSVYSAGTSHYMNGRDCRAIPHLTAYAAQCGKFVNRFRSACSKNRTKWTARALKRYARMSKCRRQKAEGDPG